MVAPGATMTSNHDLQHGDPRPLLPGAGKVCLYCRLGRTAVVYGVADASRLRPITLEGAAKSQSGTALFSAITCPFTLRSAPRGPVAPAMRGGRGLAASAEVDARHMQKQPGHAPPR